MARGEARRAKQMAALETRFGDRCLHGLISVRSMAAAQGG